MTTLFRARNRVAVRTWLVLAGASNLESSACAASTSSLFNTSSNPLHRNLCSPSPWRPSAAEACLWASWLSCPRWQPPMQTPATTSTFCEPSSRLWTTAPRTVRHGKRRIASRLPIAATSLLTHLLLASTASCLHTPAPSTQDATSTTENATVPTVSAVTTVSNHVRLHRQLDATKASGTAVIIRAIKLC